MVEATPIEFSEQEIEEGRALAGIGYLWILFLVPLLAKPDNKFCKAHAKQAGRGVQRQIPKVAAYRYACRKTDVLAVNDGEFAA